MSLNKYYGGGRMIKVVCVRSDGKLVKGNFYLMTSNIDFGAQIYTLDSIYVGYCQKGFFKEYEKWREDKINKILDEEGEI
jgi:hypothetical protein